MPDLTRFADLVKRRGRIYISWKPFAVFLGISAKKDTPDGDLLLSSYCMMGIGYFRESEQSNFLRICMPHTYALFCREAFQWWEDDQYFRIPITLLNRCYERDGYRQEHKEEIWRIIHKINKVIK